MQSVHRHNALVCCDPNRLLTCLVREASVPVLLDVFINLLRIDTMFFLPSAPYIAYDMNSNNLNLPVSAGQALRLDPALGQHFQADRVFQNESSSLNFAESLCLTTSRLQSHYLFPK